MKIDFIKLNLLFLRLLQFEIDFTNDDLHELTVNICLFFCASEQKKNEKMKIKRITLNENC